MSVSEIVLSVSELFAIFPVKSTVSDDPDENRYPHADRVQTDDHLPLPAGRRGHLGSQYNDDQRRPLSFKGPEHDALIQPGRSFGGGLARGNAVRQAHAAISIAGDK